MYIVKRSALRMPAFRRSVVTGSKAAAATARSRLAFAFLPCQCYLTYELNIVLLEFSNLSLLCIAFEISIYFCAAFF